MVGVDNFSNSSPEVLDRLQRAARPRARCSSAADVRDQAAMMPSSQRHRIDAVVHFAALKAVGESARQAARLLRQQPRRRCCRCAEAMRAARLQGASSSAPARRSTASPSGCRSPKTRALSTTNPYGQTKLMGEQILRDLSAADPGWQTACLRYFNPVGAHESGRSARTRAARRTT